MLDKLFLGQSYMFIMKLPHILASRAIKRDSAAGTSAFISLVQPPCIIIGMDTDLFISIDDERIPINAWESMEWDCRIIEFIIEIQEIILKILSSYLSS